MGRAALALAYLTAADRRSMLRRMLVSGSPRRSGARRWAMVLTMASWGVLGCVNNGEADATSDAGMDAGTEAGTDSEADLEACPAWPLSQVLPLVGPWFYGPHPGPCSRTDSGSSAGLVVVDYSYDDADRLVEAVSADGASSEQYEWDEQGRLTRRINHTAAGDTRYDYSYADDGILETSPDVATRVEYQLGPQGYVTRTLLDVNDDGIVDGSIEYQYRDCRMLRRITEQPPDSGNIAELMIYEYDSDGSLSARIANASLVTTFDYGCWQ